MLLQPRIYEYDTAAYPRMNLPAGNQMGLVAQEVETVYPELVTEVSAPVPPDQLDAQPEKFKGMNYTGVIPVLVAAVQEQQAQIDAQKTEIAALKQSVAALQAK